MTDTIRILYEYTLKNRVPAFLVGTEYEDLCQIIEQQEADLHKLLPQEGQQSMKNYAHDSEFKESLEMEAAFQAGLSLGLELSRL